MGCAWSAEDTSGRPADREHRLQCVTVIIPALNEEDALPRVLGDLPPVGRVIVVDNGSTDQTAQVAAGLGATVVQENKRGYGAACLQGLAQVRQLQQQGHAAPRVIAFIDGDYSDFPDRLPDLVLPILHGEADFVLGSRLLGNRQRGAMPAQSIFGNRLACCLMRWLYRANYSDLGPFRAIDYRQLEQLEMSDTNFGWTIEMQIKAVKAGLRIREVPVSYRPRIGTSKISGTIGGTVKAGSKILYCIGKYRRWRPSGYPGPSWSTTAGKSGRTQP